MTTQLLLLGSDELCEIFSFLDLTTIGHLMSTHKKLLHTIQNDMPQLWRLKLHQLATINPKFHLKPKNHRLVFRNDITNPSQVSMGWALFKIHRHQCIFIKIRTILKRMKKLPRSDRYFFLSQSVGDDLVMKALIRSELNCKRMLRPETFLELYHNNDPMDFIKQFFTYNKELYSRQWERVEDQVHFAIDVLYKRPDGQPNEDMKKPSAYYHYWKERHQLTWKLDFSIFSRVHPNFYIGTKWWVFLYYQIPIVRETHECFTSYEWDLKKKGAGIALFTKKLEECFNTYHYPGCANRIINELKDVL